MAKPKSILYDPRTILKNLSAPPTNRKQHTEQQLRPESKRLPLRPRTYKPYNESQRLPERRNTTKQNTNRVNPPEHAAHAQIEWPYDAEYGQQYMIIFTSFKLIDLIIH